MKDNNLGKSLVKPTPARPTASHYAPTFPLLTISYNASRTLELKKPLKATFNVRFTFKEKEVLDLMGINKIQVCSLTAR